MILSYRVQSFVIVLRLYDYKITPACQGLEAIKAPAIKLFGHTSPLTQCRLYTYSYTISHIAIVCVILLHHIELNTVWRKFCREFNESDMCNDLLHIAREKCSNLHLQ